MKISCRFEISFRSKWPIWNPYRFGFISSRFMWAQVKSWLNTEVRFSTEMKSHTGLSSFRLSCERTLRIWNLSRFTFIQLFWNRQRLSTALFISLITSNPEQTTANGCCLVKHLVKHSKSMFGINRKRSHRKNWILGSIWTKYVVPYDLSKIWTDTETWLIQKNIT